MLAVNLLRNLKSARVYIRCQARDLRLLFTEHLMGYGRRDAHYNNNGRWSVKLGTSFVKQLGPKRLEHLGGWVVGLCFCVEVHMEMALVGSSITINCSHSGKLYSRTSLSIHSVIDHGHAWTRVRREKARGRETKRHWGFIVFQGVHRVPRSFLLSCAEFSKSAIQTLCAQLPSFAVPPPLRAHRTTEITHHLIEQQFCGSWPMIPSRVGFLLWSCLAVTARSASCQWLRASTTIEYIDSWSEGVPVKLLLHAAAEPFSSLLLRA